MGVSGGFALVPGFRYRLAVTFEQASGGYGAVEIHEGPQRRGQGAHGAAARVRVRQRTAPNSALRICGSDLALWVALRAGV
ncbi:hypothetical protein GCM10010429_46120 [Micromonospora olivasterospora]